MKKLHTLSIVLLCCTAAAMADNYVSVSRPTETYYLDRKLNERSSDPVSAGLLTRAGYAFNYDAFTYGASFFYQWGTIGGITAGFDGYYIPNKLAYRTLQNDTVSTASFAMPLWDVRAGFMLTRYFLFGGMVGKTNIGDATNLINMRRDAWFIDNKESNILYGGFITFVLPVSKHFGFNIDFAVTNKTGFNIGMGLNATIPIR